MEQKWKYIITYKTIDDIARTYKNTCSLPYDATDMFQYINEYMRTGKWADSADDYQPKTISSQGVTKDTLTHAKWFLLCHLDTYIHWCVASQCVSDEDFAEAVLKEASNKAKTLPEHAKKRYQNERRNLREHKKRRKNLFSDYCYFVSEFNLYEITDFECQLLETK